MPGFYEIKYLEEPAWDIIGGGLTDFNTQQAGDERGENLCFVLEDPEGEIVGGVIGAVYWNWLYINLMWVREDLRGQGFGRLLLARIETEGHSRGAKHAYLDTFSFQAPAFYKKFGYKVFGRLKNFPDGHTRFFLSKTL
jgi:GNAT superfamily N-acetyltransferase